MLAQRARTLTHPRASSRLTEHLCERLFRCDEMEAAISVLHDALYSRRDRDAEGG